MDQLLTLDIPSPFSLIGAAEVSFFAAQESQEALGAMPRAGSEKRQRQFALGRYAARQALAGLGRSGEFELAKKTDGQVQWPSGICGSISHCGNTAICAVSKARRYAGIGLDIEHTTNNRSPGVFLRTLDDAERQLVQEISQDASDADSQQRRLQLTLFSAKESIYKAFFAATAESLGFSDVRFTMIQATSEPKHTAITSSQAQYMLLQGCLQRDVAHYQSGFIFRCSAYTLEQHIVTATALLHS